MTEAIIVAGGTPPSRHLLTSLAAPGAFIIAADRGYAVLSDCAVCADLMVGDFDSLPAHYLEKAEKIAQTSIIRRPCEKDESDLELAITEARKRGITKCAILGALGGRIDHELINIIAILSFAAELGIEARIIGENSTIFYLEEKQYELSQKTGTTVSIIPLDETLELTLSGFKYNLDHAQLKRSRSRGLSNVIISSPARMGIHKGKGLAVITSS